MHLIRDCKVNTYTCLTSQTDSFVVAWADKGYTIRFRLAYLKHLSQLYDTLDQNYSKVLFSYSSQEVLGQHEGREGISCAEIVKAFGKIDWSEDACAVVIVRKHIQKKVIILPRELAEQEYSIVPAGSIGVSKALILTSTDEVLMSSGELLALCIETYCEFMKHQDYPASPVWSIP